MRRQLLAGDVKCPRCGGQYADISHDYPIGPDPEALWWPVAIDVLGTCTNGHRFFTGWHPDPQGRGEVWTGVPRSETT